MVPLIRLSKKAQSKTEMLKDVLFLYCFTKDIKLSDTILTSMALFIQYGLNDNTINMIINSKIVSPDSMKNVLSALRKNGFIKRVNKDDYIAEEFAALKAEKVMALILKIEQ